MRPLSAKKPFYRLAAIAGAALLLLSAADPETDAVTPPPASLAKYYPPKARTAVYTREMLELGRLMGSLSVDVRGLGTRNHVDAVKEESVRFAEQYRKVSKMVPEWSGYFQLEALDRLEAAFANEPDKDTLIGVATELEATCTSCHAAELFKTQAIYDWPRFADLTTDNEAGEEVAFHETMVELSNRLGALPTAVERGDWELALAHQREMSNQFSQLETSCYGCHSEPREYFVDRQVKGEFLKLGGMIRRRVTDQSSYLALTESIYKRSCIPCHQVHMPAAFLQQKLLP